jgi:antitoxin component of MazEF toxin-antitoxin module
MKFATFTTEVSADNSIQIPPDVIEKLLLESGDRVEISVKKIKSKRLDMLLAENPLYKLLRISKE